MPACNFELDPDAKLDFSFDWSKWLDNGETISTFSVTGVGVDIAASPAPAENLGVIQFWVENGVVGVATATCEINTSAGRTDQRSMTFDVKER